MDARFESDRIWNLHRDYYEGDDNHTWDDKKEYYDNHDDIPTYDRYSGSWAQDVEGYSDDDIDTVFDGDPSAYWNID